MTTIGNVKGNTMTRTGAIDMATLGDGVADMCPRYLEVSTTAEYTVYTDPTKSRTKYMMKGIEYDGEDIIRVTSSADANLSAGVCSLIY